MIAAAQTWETDALFLLMSIAGLTVLVAVIVWIYRTMQRPRLRPTVDPDSGSVALSWQAVTRYVVTTPIMVLIWFSAILIILTWAARDRSAEELVIAAAAVVGAARLLAHLDEEMARELGKTIPLAVVGVILIGRSSATWQEFVGAIDEFDHNWATIDDYYWLLVVFDLFVTAVWIGLHYGRGHDLMVRVSRARVGRVVRTAFAPVRAVRDFGTTTK